MSKVKQLVVKGQGGYRFPEVTEVYGCKPKVWGLRVDRGRWHVYSDGQYPF